MNARVATIAAIQLLLGCASRRDAGNALVATGTVVAITGAAAATRHSTCVVEGCTRSTSKNGGAAAASVGAGVALAAAGSALAREDPESSFHVPHASESRGSG